MSVAQQVADLIHAEAQSGSASWDELNGPEAVLSEVTGSDGSIAYTIMLPLECDEHGGASFARTCLITVKETP